MAIKAGYYPVAVVAEVMRTDVDDMVRDLLRAGVKVHGDAGGTAISWSGLTRYAQVNFPLGWRSRERFLERVKAAME